MDEESDNEIVLRGGRVVAVTHAASSEDTQQTSLAKGEGGKQVIGTDRAPARSSDARQEASGLCPGHRGPWRPLRRRTAGRK